MIFGFNFYNSYLSLPEVFYQKSNLTKVKNPSLVLLNENLASDLNLSISNLKKYGAFIFSGNEKTENGAYIAMAYAGHQFGNFTMLGDGRAILIGEHLVGNQSFHIQLKGSGKTIFSRGGDGKAVLAPMLREYLISEAMYYLGIPTTRSLAVTETGEDIFRNDYEKGAILTRVSKSYIRFGTFEYANAFCSKDDLKKLSDYTINSYFSYLNDDEQKYLKFFREVLNLQAYLIALWQSIGFIHGVMNTDNMSIIGETIDYGPCAFMNIYNPDTVFSSIDKYGRYAYKNQPNICKWNLCRLAESMAHLIDTNIIKATDKLKCEIEKFDAIFKENYINIMGRKLGIFTPTLQDEDLINQFLNLLSKNKYDYTNSFIKLTENLEVPFYKDEDFLQWFKLWKNRISNQEKNYQDIQNLMKNCNPFLIPRNNLVDLAISNACNGNFSLFKEFLEELKKPYSYKFNQKFNVSYSDLTKPYKTFCGT